MRTLSLLLALAGLGAATLLIGWFGFGRVADSLASVGWRGCFLFTLVQLGLFLQLGAAWWRIAPDQGARPVVAWGIFVWGRMVRDASATLLPFSPLGGFALGARAVTLLGIGRANAAASTVVDVTLEFTAELAFALLGLLILAIRAPDSALVIPIAAVLGLGALGAAGFVWLQHGASTLLRGLGARIVGDRLAPVSDRFDPVQTAIDTAYARKLPLAISATLHLLGWIGTGTGSWLAYRLLGAPIDLLTALAIEALLSAAVSAAFIVPVAAGIQEAAYAGLGSVFGLPPELSIAVSLLRRARDLIVGVPILLIWQAQEVRRLRRAGKGKPKPKPKVRGSAPEPR